MNTKQFKPIDTTNRADKLMEQLDALDNQNTFNELPELLEQEDPSKLSGTPLQVAIKQLRNYLQDEVINHEALEGATVTINKLLRDQPDLCIGLVDVDYGDYVKACALLNPKPSKKTGGSTRKVATASSNVFTNFDNLEI